MPALTETTVTPAAQQKRSRKPIGLQHHGEATGPFFLYKLAYDADGHPVPLEAGSVKHEAYWLELMQLDAALSHLVLGLGIMAVDIVHAWKFE